MLNSLQMLNHVSPLDLMAAAAAGHYSHLTTALPARNYSSPLSSTSTSSIPNHQIHHQPTISTSDPLANECKLVDYRGQKVAAFTISGETMLCLPQAVEFFLKHAVGGPHTVYCKLKRLDIEPLVCNVEQVRILRALGAIQPFVNRCKLLSVKDFDTLFGDCTTKTISKAGRPAKKIFSPGEYADYPDLQKYKSSSDVPDNFYNSEKQSQLMPKGFNNNNTAQQYHQQQQQQHQLNQMALMHQLTQDTRTFGTRNILRPQSGNHQTENFPRLDSSIMIKLALQTGMPPDELEAMIRSGMWGQSSNEDLTKHLERYRLGDLVKSSSDQNIIKNLSSEQHSPVLNLSKMAERDNDGESVYNASNRSDSPHLDNSEIRNESTDDLSLISDEERSDNPDVSREIIPKVIDSPLKLTSERDLVNTDYEPDANISMGALLWNIQSLLKMATDNARQHEKQMLYEKAELRMDIVKEKEIKDSLEKQLEDERKLRTVYQKRYSRERKLGVRLRRRLDRKLKLKKVKKTENVGIKDEPDKEKT